ncbi:MAG: preprotein translocase subunit SecD [Tatlockia sp.]|nr:preprotein translocase subunit SecD [Tatlockia sp.]
MSILVRTIITILGMAFFSATLASSATTIAGNTNTENSSMLFQVIQSQMVFDNSTIESATIISPVNTTNTYGVNLKLKTNAAYKLGRLTEENIGKRVNIILNGEVVSSAIIQDKLGAEFLVVGLTKVQADNFIKNLALP